jgi:hypothetical protein
VQAALPFLAQELTGGAGSDTFTLALIASQLALPRTGPVAFQVASQLALPRTGGVAFQVGSTLGLALAADPSIASTAIFTDGLGDVAMAWDGGPFQFFSGVSNINVLSLAPVNVVAVDAVAPPQSPLPVGLTFLGGTPFNALFEHAEGGAPLDVSANAPLATLSF